MLAERLKELEQEGIIKRTVLPETPVKVIYCLTEKGVHYMVCSEKYRAGQGVCWISCKKEQA